MITAEMLKGFHFIDIESEKYKAIKPLYKEIIKALSEEKFFRDEQLSADEGLYDEFVDKVVNLLNSINEGLIIVHNNKKDKSKALALVDSTIMNCEIPVFNNFKNFINNIFNNKININEIQSTTTDEIIDTISEIVDSEQKGFEDSPEGALATYANNMAFIPPYHSMHQQVLSQPQQTIPQSQQINPSIQQQMVLLNKPDIVDANYALKYDLRDINEINNLTIRINKVFANPEVLEFINKFKFIDKFYVAEYKKSEFTLMAPTSTSYVYIKALSNGDYKVAEIPFKPN